MYTQNFNHAEFKNANGEWWDFMSPRLLTLLDVLRFTLNLPIHISASNFALGRHLGPTATSKHNVDFWDEVLAADIFVEGVYTRSEAEHVVIKAVEIGFTGIGVYADTSNNQGQSQVMFHLDCRPDRKMGSPATWGRVRKKYVSIENALSKLPKA